MTGLIFPHNKLIMKKNGGITPLTVTYTDSSGTGSNSSSYSFASKSIGAAPSAGQRRFIVVTAGALGSSPRDVTSITVGGVGCALLTTYQPGGGGFHRIGWVEVATGTTATIVLNTSGTMDIAGIGVWAIYSDTNGISVRSEDGGSVTTESMDLNVVAGDVVIGGHINYDAGAVAWTGLTERFDLDTNSNDNVSGADATISVDESPRTMTMTSGGGNRFATSLAVFQPA